MEQSGSSGKKALCLYSLPFETQRQIVSLVERKDLLTLQTVSRQFHGLASAEIYRHLDFNIVSSEAEDVGAPSTRAAEALQTILTSEFDYGQHIKTFRMGAVAGTLPSVGRHYNPSSHELIMTRLLWDSKTDPSKFLNINMLLMVRTARLVETFKWDAPIQLSTAVYQALHKIPTLRHLLLRLDLQPSPKIGVRSHHNTNHAAPPPPGIPAPVPTFPQGHTTLLFGPESTASKRKRIPAPPYSTSKESLSGFRHLQTLELMGISSHDILPEVAQCIKACSSTLKSLTLTLSIEMTKRTRKSNNNVTANSMPNDDISESYMDDEDDMDPPTPSLPQAPAEADIREERLAQENILATVFDLQGVAQQGKKLEKKMALTDANNFEEEDSTELQSRLNSLTKSLQETTIGTDPTASAMRLAQLKNIKSSVDDLFKFSKMKSKAPVKSSPTKDDEGKIYPPGFHDVHKSKKVSAAPGVGPMSSKYSSPSKYFSPPIPVNMPGYLPSPYPGGAMSPGVGSASASGKSSSYGVAYPSHVPTDLLPPPPQLNDAHMYLSAMGYPSVLGPLSSGQPSTGTHTPTLSNSMYYSPANGSLMPAGGAIPPQYAPSMGMQWPNTSSLSLHKHNKGKGKKPLPHKAPLVKQASMATTEDSDDTAAKAGKAVGSTDILPVESMGIDLEHPDEGVSEPGEDQEEVPSPDEADTPTPKQQSRPRASEAVIPDALASNDTAQGSSALIPTASVEVATPSPTEAMQEYVRATHGLPLEEVRIYLIPIKASILGRALDFQTLQRITLLEVGSQDTFWALLLRLSCIENQSAFKSIHTDHVTVNFAKYLATFDGLEELFVQERHYKMEADTSRSIDINRFRKVALPRHAATLKCLMFKNDRDDSWDVDVKMLQFLATKCRNLRELACNMKMSTYHVMIQMFPAFANLHAFHLITLRQQDRNVMLQLEVINFAIDCLCHCRGVRLKYLALGDNLNAIETRVDASFKPVALMQPPGLIPPPVVDRKGKGKAVEPPPGAAVTNGHEWDDSSPGHGIVEKKIRKAIDFSYATNVRIFSRAIRTGRL